MCLYHVSIADIIWAAVDFCLCTTSHKYDLILVDYFTQQRTIGLLVELYACLFRKPDIPQSG